MGYKRSYPKYKLDQAIYQYWFQKHFCAATKELSIDKDILYYAIEHELTNHQRTYLCDYYFESFSVSEIAAKYDVSKRAVCTTIQNGRKRLYNILDNVDPMVRNLFKPGDLRTCGTQNKHSL